LKENHPLEFVTSASGRRNIAFTHTTIKPQRASNLVTWFGEHPLAFLFESTPTPTGNATIIIFPIDGRDAGGGGLSSRYGKFIWELVNKGRMNGWGEDRNDLSLVVTSDWDVLPNWLAVLSESKEIGNIVLIKESREAVVVCQDILECLIVSDQPIDKPSPYIVPSPLPKKKRLTLEVNIPPDTAPNAMPKLLRAVMRLVDHLTAVAHSRPTVLRKSKAVREEEDKTL
ncbi:hypothetical protein C7212DRAFT_232515, partial [Tuber magnatum]